MPRLPIDYRGHVLLKKLFIKNHYNLQDLQNIDKTDEDLFFVEGNLTIYHDNKWSDYLYHSYDDIYENINLHEIVKIIKIVDEIKCETCLNVFQNDLIKYCKRCDEYQCDDCLFENHRK